MSGLEHDSLFAKSIVFVKRALAHRDANRLDEFQLWAALALELLGKAALAAIHPALVADPQNADSMFAACGRPISAKVKSIGASTVFARLRHLDKRFDDVAEKFCIAMAERRNADLHSGDAPFAAFLPGAWLPKYWETCIAILGMQGKSLSDWVGSKEATDAEAIVTKAMTVLEQTVRARMEVAGKTFAARYSGAALEALKNVPWPFGRPSTGADMEQVERCPACGLASLLALDYMAEELLEPKYAEDAEPEETWLEQVKIYFAATEFVCPACELHLTGQDELAAAGLPLEAEVVEAREPEWEPDYGNC